MRKRTIIFFLSLMYVLDLSGRVNSVDFAAAGRVESVRDGNRVIVILDIEPGEKEYFIMEGGRVTARLKILSTTSAGHGKFRAEAEFTPVNAKLARLVRSGCEVARVKKKDSQDRFSRENITEEEKIYKQSITCEKDGREMILIPAGKFLFGSKNGERDEFPEQFEYIGNFYMDLFEVSNRDYKKFIDQTHTPHPMAWRNGRIEESAADLPVLVTFFEAQAFAKWAGKRLPTEQEWEKAAKSGDLETNSVNIYPWGRKFDHERANCLEFWEDANVGKEIKKTYSRGLLPVDVFAKSGISPRGIVNMAGNAKEWTSSWYLPYKGNHVKNRKYGKQYRVIRGGGWNQGSSRLRVTARETGGYPNLYSDHSAGFRCVKDPALQDLVLR